MALEQGKKLGPYEIIEQAGAGGMGEVYKAKDTRLDRIVAVKVLPATFALNDDIKQRFEREAKTISSLNHPNICTLYDVGKEDGIDYLVMEFIEGETLSNKIKQGPIPMKEFLEISIQIADALDKAHRQGLIHRDLKPGNIMLTKTGAKPLDFGLAKISLENSAPGIQSITQTTPLTGVGTLVGTMQYMAPEQLEGKEADTRSDIFSFGALMYEMLTGTKAFGGGSQATLIASIIKDEPKSVSEIAPQLPPILEQTISQCLDKDPEQRWQSVGDLKRSLQWIADGKVGSSTHSLIPQNRSTRETIIMIGMICFFLATVTLAYLNFSSDSFQTQTVRTFIDPPDNAVLKSFGGGHIAISPDGRKIVFLAEDTVTNKDILWVRPLNSLEAVPLQGTDNGEYPFWSPDGKQIGFFAESKLKKVPPIGGPVLTLCSTENNARGGSWNVDNVILYSPSIQDPIHKVSAAGGEPQPVTVMDTSLSENSQRFPQFLPDQNHFIFFSRVMGGDGGEKDAVCMSSLNDPSVTRLFLAKSNAIYVDGYIYYIRETFLMVQPFDGSSFELTGDPFPIAEEVLFVQRFNKGSFTVSQNSQLIYEKGISTDGSYLAIRNRNSIEVDTLLSGEMYYTSSISPDQQTVAITVRATSADESDIWLYDLNRTVKTRFTFDGSDELIPIWSPDGSYIVYGSDQIDSTNGDYDIYMKHSSGVKPESLLVSEKAVMLFPLEFTSNSKTLLYQRFANNVSSIWALDMSTGERNSVFDTTENVAWGELSPDGRWLAYQKNNDNSSEVYVTTFPNPSGKWQVSKGEGNLPHWNEDGSEIFYFTDSDELRVTEVNSAGEFIKLGKVKTLFSFTPLNPGLVYTPFRDGQRFVTCELFRETEENKIIFVQNYKQEFIKK